MIIFVNTWAWVWLLVYLLEGGSLLSCPVVCRVAAMADADIQSHPLQLHLELVNVSGIYLRIHSNNKGMSTTALNLPKAL